MKVTKTERKPPVLLTSANSTFLLVDVFGWSGHRNGGCRAHGWKISIWLGLWGWMKTFLGSSEVWGLEFPSPSDPSPLPAPQKKQVPGQPLTRRQKSHSWCLDLLQPEVEMSFVPSGQFLHLPSPSYSHFEVKVLVVSKAISFLFLQTQMCFLACAVCRVSTHL